MLVQPITLILNFMKQKKLFFYLILFLVSLNLNDCIHRNSNSIFQSSLESNSTLKSTNKKNNPLVKDKQENPMLHRKFHVSRTDSPWNHFTSSWEEEEKGKSIKARLFPYKDFKAIFTPEGVSLGELAILYRSETMREVAIDGNYFSDLKRIDITHMLSDVIYEVGYVKNSKIMDTSFLIPFLIQGQIIIPYIHTDAELEIIEIINNNISISFHFKGEHHFYTNKKNTSPLDFLVCLNQSTGLISVKHP
jgi:hypothetical protein